MGELWCPWPTWTCTHISISTPPDLQLLIFKHYQLGICANLEGYTVDTTKRYLFGSDIFEDKEITPELEELIARSNLNPPVKAIDDTKTLSDYEITRESTIYLGI